MFSLGNPNPGAECQTPTSRSGSANGSGFSRTPRTTLKIAVLAPIPSASVSTATAVKSGARTSLRLTRRSLAGRMGIAPVYGPSGRVVRVFNTEACQLQVPASGRSRGVSSRSYMLPRCFGPS
jgi:hypothetical protein